jgi:hypothetical protein
MQVGPAMMISLDAVIYCAFDYLTWMSINLSSTTGNNCWQAPSGAHLVVSCLGTISSRFHALPAVSKAWALCKILKHYAGCFDLLYTRTVHAN